jgi:hypothetical protein
MRALGPRERIQVVVRPVCADASIPQNFVKGWIALDGLVREKRIIGSCVA